MKTAYQEISFETRGFCHIVDITETCRKFLQENEIKNGLLTLFVMGSTAGLTTVEFEPGLVKDLEELFEKIVPRDKNYHHEETWHDGNGFSHVRASLLKPSLSIPFQDNEMALGTWQQIVLIDFDNRPRSRQVAFQSMGI